MTIAISLAAFLLAGLRLPGLGAVRHVAVFFALGAGQIYLAALALLALLMAEYGYMPPRCVPRRPTIVAAASVTLVVLATLFSPMSGRTIYELIQLFYYVGVFVLFAAYLRSTARIERLLRAMVAAASLVAALGIAGYMSGMASVPHIYLGRGSNEGSLFLLLSGVIPAMTLFTATRHPTYLALTFLMAGAQMLATSNTHLAISVLAIVAAGFFLIRRRSLRVLVIVATVAAVAGALPLLHGFYERLLDYSTLERIALYEGGWAFWLERPWTGWGWGATSAVAPQVALTDQSYPHFHSAYIQFLVELGALGWLAIVAWVGGSLWLIFSAVRLRGDPAAAYYMAVMSMALLGAGVTQALLFGADRAIQVMLALALIGALYRRARLVSSRSRVDELRSAPVVGTALS